MTDTITGTTQPGGPGLERFRRIRDWVFDLDNTLYPHSADVFPQVQARIRAYLQERLGMSAEEADRVRKEFYQRYGTTLKGLMVERQVEADDFLEYVHDIDHSGILPNPTLADAIGRLPGRHFILTNGSRSHAERVAEALGVTHQFDDIFDIVWAGHLPKPSPETYDRLIAQTGLTPENAVMFEDLSRNLLVPQQRGMTTVLVVPPGTDPVVREAWELEGQDADHVDFLTDDLSAFLGSVHRALDGAR